MRIKAAGYIGSSITAEVVFGASDVPTVPCYARFQVQRSVYNEAPAFYVSLSPSPAHRRKGHNV